MYIFTLSDNDNSYHYNIKIHEINKNSGLTIISGDKKINLCKINDLSDLDIETMKLSSIDSLQIIESDYFRHSYDGKTNIDIILNFIYKHKNKVLKSLLLL